MKEKYPSCQNHRLLLSLRVACGITKQRRGIQRNSSERKRESAAKLSEAKKKYTGKAEEAVIGEYWIANGFLMNPRALFSTSSGKKPNNSSVATGLSREEDYSG